MLVPDESSAPRCRRRRAIWLFGVWAVIAWALWSVWPVRPRMTLGNGEYFQIVGITPDSRSLVALTMRADMNKLFGEDREPRSLWSGPIQVWDLNSGKARRIGLPGQSDSGERVPTAYELFEHAQAQIDSEAWEAELLPTPIQGGQLYLVQVNRDGQNWLDIVDLETGTTKRTRLPDRGQHKKSQFHFSRSGRWRFEQQPVHDAQGDHHEKLKVFDIKSGSELIDFDAVGGMNNHCFSEDETLFSFGAGDFTDEGTTQIWQLEPLKQLRVINRSLGGMAFSPDKKWIASAAYGGVEVIEIETGEVVHQFSVKGVQLRKSLFTPDGTHLIAYDYLRGFYTGGPPSHTPISEIHVWHLPTGGHKQYLSQKHIDYFDPNLCGNGLTEETTPLIVGDENRLFDILTGQTVFAIPPGTTVETLSPSGRTVILHRPNESRLNRILTFLDSWNVPYPGILWQDTDRSELLVCDVPSGRVLASLPFGHTWGENAWVTPADLVLSPDERTLVTVSSSDPPVAHVWDLPPRRPVLRPLVWSLLAPAIIVLWCRLWSMVLNKRRTKTAVGNLPTDS